MSRSFKLHLTVIATHVRATRAHANKQAGRKKEKEKEKEKETKTEIEIKIKIETDRQYTRK